MAEQHTADERSIPGPEQFQHFSDDEPVKVELEYEGNVVPFWVILVWIASMIGVVAYLVILAYPDAVDWNWLL